MTCQTRVLKNDQAPAAADMTPALTIAGRAPAAESGASVDARRFDYAWAADGPVDLYNAPLAAAAPILFRISCFPRKLSKEELVML